MVNTFEVAVLSLGLPGFSSENGSNFFHSAFFALGVVEDDVDSGAAGGFFMLSSTFSVFSSPFTVFSPTFTALSSTFAAFSSTTGLLPAGLDAVFLSRLVRRTRNCSINECSACRSNLRFTFCNCSLDS